MNTFLRELCDWLNADRLGKKVLFVNNTAAGNQLLRMAAAHGCPAVNVVAMPVRKYMEQLAEPELAAQGLQKIDAVTAAVGLQSIMEEYGEGQFATRGRVELKTAQYMLPQLDELEDCDTVPAQLRDCGETLLAEVWQKFLDWKKESGYVSARQLMEMALPVEKVSYAILSDTQLMSVEKAFLDKIPEGKLVRIHMAVPENTQLPRRAVLLQDGPFVSVQEKLAAVPCVRCQETGSEIRHAFQYLLENRIPAEDAVFVCPDQDYGMRVEAEGKLLNCKVDSTFGMPASMTKTAQLVDCLLEWSGRNYDVEALVPALTASAFAVQNEKGESLVSSRRMLYLFRKYAVGWGADRWEQFAASEKAECAWAGQFMCAWIHFFEKEPAPARDVGTALSGLLARSMKRGKENSLFLQVADEISRIYPENMTGREYLERVKEIISGMNVDSGTTENPGKVFCCGYPNAPYVNRKHFLLLGMSWDTFDKLSDEFPLLHDDKKKVLSPLMRLVGDRAAENRYAVKALLANREDAEILFSRAEKNHVGGKEILEASVYADAARKYMRRNRDRWEDDTPRVTILGRKALSISDLFLRSGIAAADWETELDEGRESLWQEAFDNRDWSATRLETALSCPRRFTLQVQMGLDAEKPGPLAQYGQGWLSPNERGNLIHKILEKYFEGIMPRRDDVNEDLLSSLCDQMVEEWEQKVPVPGNLQGSDALRAEKEKVRDVARQEIMLHVTDPERKTVAIEVPFGMDGEEFRVTFGRHTIRINGRIDRVDQVGDHYEIVDYKTGNPFTFEEKLDRKLQYYLYTLAWEQKHPGQQVTLARYDLLDGAGNIAVMRIPMTEEKRQEMYERVENILNLLSDPVTAMTTEGMLYPPLNADDDPCDRYCPFRVLCKGNMDAQLSEGLIVPEEPAADEEE